MPTVYRRLTNSAVRVEGRVDENHVNCSIISPSGDILRMLLWPAGLLKLFRKHVKEGEVRVVTCRGMVTSVGRKK